MVIVTAFYLLLCAAAVASAHLAPPAERRFALPLSVALGASCLFSNLMWYGRQEWSWPAVDAMLVVLAAAYQRAAPRQWKAVLLVALYFAFCAHWARALGLGKFPYELTLNLCFLLMLLAVASPGSGRVRQLVRGALAGRVNPGRHRFGPVVLRAGAGEGGRG